MAAFVLCRHGGGIHDSAGEIILGKLIRFLGVRLKVKGHERVVSGVVFQRGLGGS